MGKDMTHSMKLPIKDCIKYTTLQEAVDAGMTGTALIMHTVDDQDRRNSLFHIEVNFSQSATVCGRSTEGREWIPEWISIPALARRVAARDNLCSECLRQILFYDFTLGKEPTRIYQAEGDGNAIPS